MVDYVGSRPKKKGKGGFKFLFFLMIAAVLGGLYVYFNNIWPQKVLQDEFSKVSEYERLLNEGCSDNDPACLEEIKSSAREVSDNVFAKLSKKILAMPLLKERLIKEHRDGSSCFLVDGATGKDPSDEELAKWLGGYGVEKYLSDAALISRAKNLYESRYHKPDPFLAQHDFIKELRWKRIPFGRDWRDITLAVQYMEWIALAKPPALPKPPSEEEKRVLEAMKADPSCFTDRAINRLTTLAKRSLTLERLAKVRDAMRRYRVDVREYPVDEDGKAIRLEWLASKADLPSWLKGRWYGPYIDASMISDLWGCPIAGIRSPATGEMMLVSYGGDCQKGGDGEGKDISLVLTAAASAPETGGEEAVEKQPQDEPAQETLTSESNDKSAVENPRQDPSDAAPPKKKFRKKRERVPELDLTNLKPKDLGYGPYSFGKK